MQVHGTPQTVTISTAYRVAGFTPGPAYSCGATAFCARTVTNGGTMPKLTKTAIDTCQPAKHDVWLWDNELPGFGVRVQPSGRKTYVVRYRTKRHQQRKYTIARTCDMAPGQARDLARKVFAEVAAGADPAETKREAKDTPTVAGLLRIYNDLHNVPYKKPSTVREEQYLYRNHIVPRLGAKKLDAVTHMDVQRLHASLGSKRVTANRCVAVLSAAYAFAVRHGYTDNNPCKGVPRHREHGRMRILTRPELARLYDELETGEYAPGFVRLVRLLLLTGCRLSELQFARMAWVDFDNMVLRLPDAKAGPRAVPLSSEALGLISQRIGAVYLCEGLRRDKPVTSVHRAWGILRVRAGIEGVRIHDLRHTVGSYAHRAGLTQRQVADLLGHRRLSTTERYIHAAVGDMAAAARIVAQQVA